MNTETANDDAPFGLRRQSAAATALSSGAATAPEPVGIRSGPGFGQPKAASPLRSAAALQDTFPRRMFLSDLGMGFTGLALGATLFGDGVAKAAAPAQAKFSPMDGRPHFRPRAKSVIWIFLSGGYSHVEAFDPKPALTKYAGLSFDKTPLANPLKSDKHHQRFRSVPAQEVNVRDVRLVQVYPSGYGTWDSHAKLKDNHPRLCTSVDKPVAGLLKDLKQRGLLDETIVVFCTEFGRTPGLETRGGNKDGRDHHPHGFTIWFAGAGIQRGIVHGETDELGYHAQGEGHYVTDLHATVLHLLGLDNRRLEVPGRKCLEIDHGHVIREILA